MNTLLDKLRGVIQREISELNNVIYLEAKRTLPDFIHAIKIEEKINDKNCDVIYDIEFVDKIRNEIFTLRIRFKDYYIAIDNWDNRNISLPTKIKAYKYKLMTFIEEEIERFNNE